MDRVEAQVLQLPCLTPVVSINILYTYYKNTYVEVKYLSLSDVIRIKNNSDWQAIINELPIFFMSLLSKKFFYKRNCLGGNYLQGILINAKQFPV